MTRTTRRTVCCIAIIAFIAAVVIFFAIATSGFTNWNGATWFNCWGNGSPMAQDQDELQSKAAVNAGLTHDSELSVAVAAEVKQWAKPEVEICEDGIHVTCSGAHGGSLLVEYQPLNRPVAGTLTYGTNVVQNGVVVNAYDEKIITFDDLRDKIGAIGPYGLYFYHGAGADYKASEKTIGYWYIMPEGDILSVMTIEDTTVKLPFPAVAVDNEVWTWYYSVEIASADGSVSDTFLTNQASDNDLFTVVKNGDERYVAIDLTKLSFINYLTPVCNVHAELYVVGTSNSSYLFRALHFSRPVSFGIVKLDTPKDISYAGGTLSWGAVAGALGYAVFDGNDLYMTTTRTELYLPSHSLITVGSHVFRVRALGNVGSALAASEASLASLTPFNASARITQIVTLTYDIDGDISTSFVPLGDAIGEYLHDVKIPGKEFGGWFYDSGFSREVKASDKLESDTTIYARLTDEVIAAVKQSPSWWSQYKWYVLIPCISLVVIGAAVGGVIYYCKKKQA